MLSRGLLRIAGHAAQREAEVSLELHVPELPSHAANVQVAPALWHLWPKFFTYAVAFLSLGVYWIAHHHMYHAIQRADRVLLWLTILFFMFVSMLSFATSVLNAFRQTQIAPCSSEPT